MMQGLANTDQQLDARDRRFRLQGHTSVNPARSTSQAIFAGGWALSGTTSLKRFAQYDRTGATELVAA